MNKQGQSENTDSRTRFRLMRTQLNSRRVLKSTVLLLAASCLMSCRAPQVIVGQFQAKPLVAEENYETLERRYTNLVLVASEIDAMKDTAQQKRKRNDALSDLMRLSDFKYEKFKTKLHVGDAGWNSAIDIASIGLSGAATLVGGGTAQALSGADTALKATQGKILERWLNGKAMRLLLLTMDARRAEVRTRILEGMKKRYDQFSIEEGLRMIDEFHQCANLPNAMTHIEATMGAQKNTNEVAVKVLESPAKE